MISNRKINFEYHIMDKYICGIKLKGSEVKSIRNKDVSISESYCFIENNKIFIKNMYIKEYKNGGYANHTPTRDRELLLNKSELRKLGIELNVNGITLIPNRLYFNEKNLIKIEIAVCKGKKNYDKRETIKARDIERSMKKE